jgi:hypothetical protein
MTAKALRDGHVADRPLHGRSTAALGPGPPSKNVADWEYDHKSKGAGSTREQEPLGGRPQAEAILTTYNNQ